MGTELDTKNEVLSEGVTRPGGEKQRASCVSGKIGAWSFLSAHAICCIALSLVIAYAVDGYEAIDTSTHHFSSGKLLLRVSDITTLISTGLVIVKFLGSCWTAIAVWRCAEILMQNNDPAINAAKLKFMKKYKMLPWIRCPAGMPKGGHSWAIAVVMLVILPQSFTAPLISGAVNWNSASVPAGKNVQVNLTNSDADFSSWEWYNRQDVTRREYLRRAAGLASIVSADTATMAANGTSITGNGCRRVVNDDGLVANSTLANASIPCIKIHNISWATSEVPTAVSNLVEDSSPLSLVGDDSELYYMPGESVLYDPNNLWVSDSNWDVSPDATLFSGTLYIGLHLFRGNCTTSNSTAFGDVNKLNLWIHSWGGNCFLHGNVSFTAGATTSPRSTYIASRIVEDQTPLDDVIFEPNSWVQESLWLMPDLMTMVAVMNSSQLPTWENLNGFTETLIRQSYLGAMNMFYRSFDMDGPLFTATPLEPRIQAAVSFERVFSWLGISLLMTLCGVLLLLLPSGDGYPVEPSEILDEEKQGVNEGIHGFLEGLF